MGKMKLKVKKSVARRFKVTKTGKVMHGRQNTSHLKSNKSKTQKRRGKEPTVMSGAFAKRIKKLLAE